MRPTGHAATAAGSVSRLRRRGAERLVATTSRSPFRPPLPPEDRVWRHPSELGGAGHAGRAAGFVAVAAVALQPDPRRRSRSPSAPPAPCSGRPGQLGASAPAAAGPLRPCSRRPAASRFAPTHRRATCPTSRRPADGVVHLVATTADRPPDRQRRRARHARHDRHHRRRRRRCQPPSSSIWPTARGYAATLLGIDDESGARRRARQRPPAGGVERLGRDAVGRRHRARRRRTDRRPRSRRSAPTPSADNGQVAVAPRATRRRRRRRRSPRAPRCSTTTSWSWACPPTTQRRPRCTPCRSRSPGRPPAASTVHGRVVVPWLGVSGRRRAGTDGGATVQSIARRLARRRAPGSRPAT